MCKMRGLVITTLAGFMATSIYAQIQITPEVGTSIYKEGRIKVEGKATISPRIGVGVDYFFNQQKNGWGLMSGLYFYQKRMIIHWYGVHIRMEKARIMYFQPAYIMNGNQQMI